MLSVPHPLYEILNSETETFEQGYFDTGRREITIDEDYKSELIVFDERLLTSTTPSLTPD